MKKKHLLVVDDDYRIRKLLSQYLSENGYLVTSSQDTIEAREALKNFDFDLIILDVLLPKELGTDFAKILKKSSHISILMLTALGTPEERIKGLESGADDYMAKPFNPKELLLRIEKLIERHKEQSYQSESHINLGKVKYNVSKNILIKNDKEVALNTSEAKLLSILLENKGSLINRELISKKMNINPRSVDVQIKRLREKIEEDPRNPVLLQTVRGKGYALLVD
jgi:two-component system, OmpR family, phosphate regulon response regulator OmpR